MGVFRTFSVRNAFTNSHPCLEILILRIEDEGEVLSNLVIQLADKQMGRVLSVRENGIQSYQDILKESNKELRYSFTHFYFDEGFAFASKNYLATSLRTALLERLIQSVHNRQRGGDWIIEQLERTISGWEGSGKSGGADLVKLVKHSHS